MKRDKRSRLLIWGLSAMAILLMAGCGGGGDGGGDDGGPSPQSHNRPPVISSLRANPASVQTGGSSTVTVRASDPDGDPLSYSWRDNGGIISSPRNRSSVTWTAPQSPGTYTVTVTVSDNHMGHGRENEREHGRENEREHGRGHGMGHSTSSRSVNITVSVLPPPPPPPARKDIGVEKWQEVSPK